MQLIDKIAIVTPEKRTFMQVIKFVKDPSEFKWVSKLDDAAGCVFKGSFQMWDSDKIRGLDELLYWVEQRTKSK